MGKSTVWFKTKVTCIRTLYKYAMPVWVSWWNVSQREDGFFRGRSPRENHPPEGRHSIRIPTLAWHICFIISNKPQFGKISMKTTMTASRSAGAVEKSVCYNVKVTDDWWFTHSPLGVTSDNGGHYADQWTWWLPTVKSANHGLRSLSEVW